MMATRKFAIAACLLLAAQTVVLGQGAVLPAGDKEPVLRLEAEGPTSFVTALTFSPDGKRLYAAGFDKVVRVWALNPKTGRFDLDTAAYRVPIGPGIDGALNAVVLSPDEKWLAVAGQSIVRGAADFRRPGLMLPKTGGFTEAMWKDQGTIYVFNTQNRAVHILRGHMGPVWSLAFAPEQDGKPLLLASAARERDMENHTYHGGIRVWDVVKGTQVAARTGFSTHTPRPGLAVWHTGRQPKELRVAVAWEDGVFRVWDVDTDKVWAERDGWNGAKDGMYNNTLALLADRHKLITGSRRVAVDTTKGSAQLQQWDLGAEGPKRDERANFTLEKDDLFPRSLSLVSSRAGRAPDLAAVVMLRVLVEDGKQLEDYFLDLVDLQPGNFGTRRSRIALWGGGGKLPVVTSASSGRHLAVAGNKYHSIRVYSVADLLEKQNDAEPQVLKSVGSTFRFIAFVRKGNDQGLLLNKEARPLRGGRPRDPAEGDVVFNVTQRNFTTDLDDWKIDAPALKGWNVEHAPARKDDQGKLQGPGVTVWQGMQKPVTVRLQPEEVVSDYALLPAMPPLNVPILAVAFHELGQPTLSLYNAETGEQVRRFTGHTERINSLAFSADGRFLASVAEDQTIAVFSMAKLEKYLGKLGMLPGVAVKNVLVIGAAGAGELKEYDVVEGLRDGAKLQRYYSIPTLYRDVAQVKPGGNITLQVRAADGTEKLVELKVGQKIVAQTRCLLLGLGTLNPLAVAGLATGSGQFSTLPGVTVKYAPVVLLSPDKALVKDDLIEGLVEAGKLTPLASARDFYEAMALRKPGDKVVLQVRGKGNVAVVVGQGSDERKPLFSLFVTAGAKPDQWEWVGWNPVGPYESSDRKAERYIGWHFNTGDPQAPATFALADQYRKEYYRDGILKFLIARGDLAPALKDWQDIDKRKNLPQPKMTLWIDEVGPDPRNQNGLGQVVVRQTPVKLKLAVDDFPLERVEGVDWQLDGGEMRKFQQDQGRERTTELDLKRGVVKVRAVVRTQEAQPQVYTKELVVRYLPPAPAAKPIVPQRQVVNAPAFVLRATIQPGRSDQDATVSLAHKHKDKELHKQTWDIDKPKNADDKPRTLTLEEKVNLQEGDNVIEVVAVNKEAAPDREGLETDRLSWLITYVPPAVKVPPPRVLLDRLVTLPESGEEGRTLPLEPGKTTIVYDPAVKVVGKIEATANLVEADWKNKAKGGKLAGLGANQKALDVSQKLELEPGAQTVSFLAKSAGSDAAEQTVTIDYRPPLPKVMLTAPAQGLVLSEDGSGPPTVQVAGLFSGKLPALEAVILLNDQPAAKVPAGQAEWSVPVPLKQAGDNRIQVRLKNQWDMVSTTEAVHVRYVRPPRDIRFDQKEVKTDKPLIDLSARVHSPLPLLRETVEAEVNDREIVTAQVVPPAQPGDQTWGIRLKNVPLEPNKKNTVRLWVSNPEARSPVPGELTVEYVPPAAPPARAEVDILEPMKDVNVTDADLAVRFRVKSASPLKRIELVRDGRTPVREAFDLAGLKPDAQGYYQFSKVLRLAPRENPLRVVALNDGGEQQAAVVVNYLHMPVRLILDKFEAFGQPGKAIVPKVLPDGKLEFPPAPEGRVTLSGRVAWSKDNDEQLRKISLVRVYVNGFQQIPAELRPASGDSRERVFRVDLLLNRSQNNHVEIEMPDLKQDSSNRREFGLACARPEPGQRLHMLIVGIGAADEKKLTDQALLALRATKDKGQLKTPAFSEVRIYGPLTDFVSPDQVYTQLCLIKKTIDVLAAQGSPNDVVMLYYQGGEAVKTEGNFFETSVTKYDRELRRSGITFKGLQGFFDETLGAKLLWLDVAKGADDKQVKDEVARMPPNAYFSVMRYKWPDAKAAHTGGGLLGDWKKAMDTDKIGILESVTAQVSTYFKQHPTALTYDRYIPAGLAALLVDQKAKP